MDEKDYELLLELYEHKNITKVAQRLYMTQPAITKRIQKMEEELQCQLLLRSKKGVIFTPVGECILPCAAEILKASSRLHQIACASQNVICGSLNLGSSLNFSHYRLPAILKSYKELYPLVDIKIITGQSRNLYRLLKEDRISIAILRGQFHWDEEMRLISREPMCLVCSRENIGKPLDQYPYIKRHTDAELTSRLEQWIHAHGLSHMQSTLRIDNIDTCKEMARYGLGWCILPKICLGDFDGYIEELTLENGQPFTRSTYVLCKTSYAMLPQVRLFLDALTEDPD